MGVEIRPLTAERWEDVTALFGKQGACSGCWCMWWRQTGAEYGQQAGTANCEAFRHLVEDGRTPGLLAYREERAVGWCSIAPRQEFEPRIERSRFFPTLRQLVDSPPVWSIVCFYVGSKFRRQGISKALLAAAVEHAARHGARTIEAYPTEGFTGAGYRGAVSMYQEAGFEEAASHKGVIIMRYRVG